jgi:hypothetical protein
MTAAPTIPDLVPSLVALCRWLHEGGPGDPLDTEWLGWAYQQASAAARKGRALVQTPGFVRELILDRTLGEVLARSGPATVRLIDPSCGCGHFLVDAFRRTLAAWLALPRRELDRLLAPGGGVPEGAVPEAVLAQVVLDQVVGVDLDPACVAIARTRLLLEAWHASDVRMPYRIHVFEGDSLLHGRPRPGDEGRFGPWPYDVAAVRAALRPGRYSVVVGNPPFIRCPDPGLREAYRDRYPTCSGQYPMSVPFTELMFDLAIRGRDSGPDRRVEVKEEQGVLFVA